MSGFPLDISELDITRLVGPYSDIETIKIVRDRKSGKCKGYAFLEMQNEAAANRAIAAFHNQPSGDRLLTLKIATRPQGVSPKVKTLNERPLHTYVKVNRPGEQAIKNKRPRKIFQTTDPGPDNG
ncbi:hypothetical protein [Mucilaginibacter sp. 22184]|uniref:hypothetical protein n=1 Tax=Mucilaginibacter sp. 22184 TaxID=3453887 RepID=UPI003F83AF43